MEHKCECFVPECKINELSLQKKLYPFLIDVNDIKSWIIGVGSSELINNIPNNNTRTCEQYFLCTDHLNFFNSVDNAAVTEEDKIQEEDSSNTLSQQLSTLSVSTVYHAPDNDHNDLDVAEFIDILESQNSKEFDELIDSLGELSQKTTQQKNDEDICRVCGIKSPETFSIFSEENSKDISLIDKLTFCLPIKIEINDNLPKVICSKCYGILNQSHELAMLSLMTANHLTGNTLVNNSIEPSSRLQEIRESFEGEKNRADEESSSQDTLTDLESVKPSISSLITDDEDPAPCSMTEDSADGARPLKIRRVEPSFDKRFECNWCSASFTDEEQMAFHKHRHRLKKPILFWCNCCHSEFRKKEKLMKHVMSCHREQYHTLTECFKCKKCCEIFSLKSCARIHFINDCGIHPIEDYTSEKYIENLYIKYMYTCEYCYKNFASITKLHEHKNKCHHMDNDNMCQVNQKNNDIDTMNNFGIKNTFVCKYCTKTFIHFNSLIYHQLEHLDHKFHCSMCDKKFCTWTNTKEHRENEHFYQIIYREKTARLCICFCGMEFNEEEGFMIHEKSHFIGTRLYEVYDDKTISQPITSTFDNSLGSLLENFVNTGINSLLHDN